MRPQRTIRRTLTRVPALTALVATGALVAIPVAQASHKPSHDPGHGKEKGNKSCKRPEVKKAFVVKGTLDAPATAELVDITATGANGHARRSGEIEDQNADKRGVQVDGADYQVDGATDPFELRLLGYGDGEETSIGDKVRVKGKVSKTRRKCADEGSTPDERYGEVDVKKVKVIATD